MKKVKQTKKKYRKGTYVERGEWETDIDKRKHGVRIKTAQKAVGPRDEEMKNNLPFSLTRFAEIPPAE